MQEYKHGGFMENPIETVYCSPEVFAEVIAKLDPFQSPANEQDYALAGYETEFDRLTR